jgi:hypothetical protein
MPIWKFLRILEFAKEAGRSSLQKYFKKCLCTGPPNGQLIFLIAIFGSLCYQNITICYHGVNVYKISNKMSNGLIAFSRVPSQGLEKSLCTFIGLTTRQLWHQLQHNLLLQNALRNPDALIVMFGFITHLSFSSYLKASGYGLEFLEKWYLRSSHLKQLCTVMECHSYRNKRGELAHKRVSVLSGWVGIHFFHLRLSSSAYM